MAQIDDDSISSSNRLRAKADFARTTALGADAVIRTNATVTCFQPKTVVHHQLPYSSSNLPSSST
jgi:hypothetical protein